MSKWDNYESLKFKQHAATKSMWKGTSDIVEVKDWFYDKSEKKFIYKTLKYSPALYKIVDEIIANALDQWWIVQNTSDPVTKIDITFKDKKIFVRNNGEGIIIRKNEHTGNWIPQEICTKEFSGCNLKDDPLRVTGGTNGVGMKITAIMSTEFTIQTVYGGKRYTQRFLDGTNTIEEPVIEEYSDEPYTEMSFIPNYEKMGGYNDNIAQLIRTRAETIAVFIGAMGKKCKVTYNGINIPTFGFRSSTKKWLSNSTITMPEHVFTHKGKVVKMKWNIAYGIKSSESNQYSIINGILTKGGGSHINYIIKQISEFLYTKMEKDLKFMKTGSKAFMNRIIKNNSFILFVGHIGDPKWDSQTKDTVSIKQSNLQHVLGKPFLNGVWKLIQPIFTYEISMRLGRELTKSVKKKISHDKYQKAKKSGKRYGSKCTLIITEGDSAELMIKAMMNSGENPELNNNYYGLYNIGGVPINARKSLDKNGNQSRKLINSQKLQGLVQVLGLDYSGKHSLNYGRVVVAADQDNDGVGHIFGLILNFFEMFFRDLIDKGFLYRYETPVIRVYPKNKGQVINFYSDEDFLEWKETVDMSKYQNPRFIKGLAGHFEEEIPEEAINFENHLKKIVIDEDATVSCELFYGENVVNRRAELRKPLYNIEDKKSDMRTYIEALIDKFLSGKGQRYSDPSNNYWFLLYASPGDSKPYALWISSSHYDRITEYCKGKDLRTNRLIFTIVILELVNEKRITIN